MQDLPHHYIVKAEAQTAGNVTLSSTGAPDLPSAPPAEFGGPGDQWSPESLLVAAVADCFILSFRAIARASRFEWESLGCEVEGTLERIERVTQFTVFDVTATLKIAAGSDEDRARKLLEKAEHVCLITNSLKAEFHLEINIQISAS